MSGLRQRGEDGYPVGADRFLREAYGQIPASERFLHNDGLHYETPVKVLGWEWSTLFCQWTALVEFSNGWRGFTWPEPEINQKGGRDGIQLCP